MSTAKPGAAPVMNLPHIDDLRIAVVQADWNTHITSALAEGVVDVTAELGYGPDAVDIYHVPGTVELTYAARTIMDYRAYDAIVIIGCVIRGDTPHFDYVCQSVTQGMTELNLRGDIPVIFSVLTVENEQQALDRAGGALGNKGREAAEAAIVMANYKSRRRK